MVAMAILNSFPNPSGRPMSIRAFAEASQTSPRRIRRLIRQGRLQTIENQAGEVRIPESELDRLATWQESRIHSRSMELSPVSMEMDTAARDCPVEESYGLQVPLQRHEAVMMRLGYLESELANTRQRLDDTANREGDFKQRAETAEQELIKLKIRYSEMEDKLEDMRTQMIDSTFRAVELQNELKNLREKMETPWWQRMLQRKQA